MNRVSIIIIFQLLLLKSYSSPNFIAVRYIDSSESFEYLSFDIKNYHWKSSKNNERLIIKLTDGTEKVFYTDSLWGLIVNPNNLKAQGLDTFLISKGKSYSSLFKKIDGDIEGNVSLYKRSNFVYLVFFFFIHNQYIVQIQNQRIRLSGGKKNISKCFSDDCISSEILNYQGSNFALFRTRKNDHVHLVDIMSKCR